VGNDTEERLSGVEKKNNRRRAGCRRLRGRKCAHDLPKEKNRQGRSSSVKKKKQKQKKKEKKRKKIKKNNPMCMGYDNSVFLAARSRDPTAKNKKQD